MKAKQVKGGASKFAPIQTAYVREPKVVGFHRLTIRNEGAHTSHLPDRLVYTVFYDDSSIEEITEIEFNCRYKGCGLPLYGGSVEQPFNRFYGKDTQDVYELFVQQGLIALAQE